MIHLRDVSKSYTRGEQTVLACAVDRLDVEAGEQVALIGRSGTGMDIAQNAVFLASDESEWTTAQVFIVDGGITTFDAPNKGWMADTPAVDPVPLRGKL